MFGVQARFDAGQVTVSGVASEYVRKGDAGSHGRFRFCANCGAIVVYTVDEMPGVVIVPVGAFAEPGFPAPAVSVYEERMHAWVGLPAHIEHIA